MYQWSLRGFVGAFCLKGVVQRCSYRCVFYFLIILQSTNLAIAGTSSPIWKVPARLHSDDGYAFLDWTLPVGQAAEFFRITETFDNEVTVHYTESTGLRAWRVEPGEYNYVLQACVKTFAGVPDCGAPSEALTLVISKKVKPGRIAEIDEQATQVESSTDVDGGPDRMRPGSWTNLRKAGQGWHFYWANRLALPEDDPLFGTGYDLVGVWLTHEAKDVQADPDCPECPPVAAQYRPVAVNLRAVSTGPDTFGGGMYINRGGSEIWVGGFEVGFTFHNSQAVLDWSADFKNESLSDSESLSYGAGPDPLQPTGISHLSGIWNYSGNGEFYVISILGQVGEGSAIVFQDANGDPAWISAFRGGTPVRDSKGSCYRYLINGYSPVLNTPPDWTSSWYTWGCSSLNILSSNGGRYFSDSDLQYLWVDFTLPGTSWASGSITVGSSESPVPMTKSANFHAISYYSATGQECELTSLAEVCGISLSWYTDSYYPAATVYAHNLTTDVRYTVATSSEAIVSDMPYEVSDEGVYAFELRAGNGVDTALLAKSDQFLVTANIANSPPTISIPETQMVIQGSSVSLPVPVNDVDGDALSCDDGSTLPAGLTVMINAENDSCDISGQMLAAVGSFTSVLTVEDNNGLSASGELGWEVLASGGNPETPPSPAAPPDMTASPGSSKVGATAGEFRVDESGSATYSIPILTAPASGGVAPQISLDYSSHGGNGDLGVGWALGGVSAISRCPQTMEQDAVEGSRGISLDDEDRFCLDGQRLIADLSTGEYGKNGTQYRTEIDSFTRITSYGAAGNGPAWFKVEHKDGTVLEYGNSSDSRIEARGSSAPETVYTWARNRFQDRSGNYMLYSYLENDSGPLAYVLQAIDYAGNFRAGTLPSARLSFAYGERSEDTDLSFSYLAGAKLEQRYLLQSIRLQSRLQAGNPLEDLRFYQLKYDEDGVGRQILTTLTECRSASRTICYPPTRFEWLKSESEINTSAAALDNLLPKRTLSGMLLADVNGDGRPDLVYTQKKGKNHFLHIKQALSVAGFSEWETTYELPRNSDGKQPRVFAIDINTDGFQDVVYGKYSMSEDDYTWAALISDGSAFSAEIELNPANRFSLDGDDLESRIRVMDFNGDGLSDILHVDTTADGNAWSLNVQLNSTVPGGIPSLAPTIELDVDNTDLFPIDHSGEWGLSDFPPRFDWDLSGAGRADTPDTRIFDFNGDGAADLLLKIWRDYQRCIENCVQPFSTVEGKGPGEPVYEYRAASFWVLMESTGENSYSRHSVVAKGEECNIFHVCGLAEYDGLPRTDTVWPVDINTDGLADIAWADQKGDWYFQYNNGAGFLAAVFIAHVPDGVNELARFEDWNDDSYPDLAYPSAVLDGSATWMVSQNHFGRVFAAAVDTMVLAGNVGGDADNDPVENDVSVFADFTGDGKADQLFIDSKKTGEITSTGFRMGTNVSGSPGIEPANVITRITNGFGAVTEIVYRPLTDSTVYTRSHDAASVIWGKGAPVYDYFSPVFVVGEVSVSAPVFADPDALSKTEYHYVGAKLQAGGRGLLGFAEIIVFDPQLLIRTNTRYRQDFPFIGVPVDTAKAHTSPDAKFSPLTIIPLGEPTVWPAVTSDTQPPTSIDGALLSYSINQWRELSTISGATHIYLATSLSRNYTLSGNLEGKVFAQNVFDGFGNITSTTISTFADDGAVPFSMRTTSNTWSAANLPDWNLGRLNNSTATHARTGKPSVIRNSAFEYDGTTGLVTSEVIEPESISLEVVTTFSYDLFGNRTTTNKQGVGMSARTSSVAYDALGRFAVQETNALGQVFSRVSPAKWDVFGNPLEIENIDGVLSIAAADLMGREFASYNESGDWQITLNYMGSGSHCPDEAAWHSISNSGGGARGLQCFDVIGRAIRKAGSSIDNRLVFVDQFYEGSGRPSRISEPYFESGTRYWNETAYDILGRVTGLLSAGGDDISIEYDELASSSCAASGPGFVVKTNALGHKSTEVKNVLGETIESFDDNCGETAFDYDSTGKLTSLTADDGSVTSITYDVAGRKIALADPDKGSWQYAYNALGELTRQLDSKQQAIDFEYDSLGRVTHRRELSNVNSLSDMGFMVVNHEATSYRSASPGKSQVASITYFEGEGGAVIHQQTISYDPLGRESDVSNTVGNQQFYQQTTYDAYGRIFQQFDASGGDRGLRYVYSYGHLSQLKEARDGVDGMVYQEILEMDPRGNIASARLGNGIISIADFNPANGQLMKLSAYDQLGVEMQEVDYLFDVLGNLKSRHDQSGSADIREDFGYDSMNRLKQVNLTAPAFGIPTPVETLALDYDAMGNITWKSDVGAYTYGSNGAGPHAVSQAGTKAYSYDSNGNQSSGGGRSITYTLFDKVASLTAGNESTTFIYGIGNQRVQRKDLVTDVVETSTVYLGNVEFINRADGGTSFKRYLGGAALATYYPATSVQQVVYLLKDHIGSIHSVLNEEGLITTRMHFGPFGERQEANWQTPLDSFLYAPLNELTTRGFTGHEQVDSMGVIHMNGRIYDPKLGRFLQADPVVQSPMDGQSHNRYSYALNNPLSYTDPSGYFSIGRFIKKWGRLIVAAVASYFTFGAAYAWAATSLANAAAAGTFVHGLAVVKTVAAAIGGASSGFIGGAILSGTLKGAVKGAFAGAITAGIAKYYGDTYNLGRVASESIGGGVSARIQGAKFEDGLKFSLIVSTMTYLNYRMDFAERRNSARNPDNLNKRGSGLFGRRYSIAGARRTVDPETGRYMACRSPAGGCQGLPFSNGDQMSNLLGIPYNTNGTVGYVVDSFAGPHDWFRNHASRSYDSLGNSKYFTGIRKIVDQVANAALIPVATPFSMAALIGTQSAMYMTAQGYLHGE
jgi:RHS repeat-associated protein